LPTNINEVVDTVYQKKKMPERRKYLDLQGVAPWKLQFERILAAQATVLECPAAEKSSG